jgi:WD40 repeat protein
LFEHWQLLNDWLDSSRDDIRFKRRLEMAAQYWNEKGRPEGLLWRSPDLALLQAFCQRSSRDLTDLETDFWKASNLADRNRKRNRRLATGGLVFGFVLTSISSGVAFWKFREANRNSIQVLTQSSATLNASGEEFASLITALKAGKQLQNSRLFDPILANQIKEQFFILLTTPNREITRLEGHDGEIERAKFSPDGKMIATASSDGTAKLWALDGDLIATLEGHNGVVSDVSFAPRETIIATASHDNTAKLWSPNGTLITTFKGHSDRIRRIIFSPKGEYILTGSFDGTSKIWNKNGENITTLRGHNDVIFDAQFSSEGDTIATASYDGTVKLWGYDGSLIHTLEDKNYRISSFSFSPDGKTIATAGSDGIARIWNKDGKVITTLVGHTDSVDSVQFSPDGQNLVTTSYGVSKVWKVNGEFITTLDEHSEPEPFWIRGGIMMEPPKGHGILFGKALFSHTSDLIAKASYKNVVQLWSKGGILVATLEGHLEPIKDINFSP